MPRVRAPTATVTSSPLPAASGVPRPDDSGARALQRAVEGVTSAGAQIILAQRRAREDALSVRLEELEGEYTGAINEGLHRADTGVLNLQGRNASEASVPFYEALEKRRTALLEQVEDERARRILDVRTRKLTESARARVEDHVGRQNQVADDTSFSLLKAEVKDRLAAGALDVRERLEATEQLVPHLRAYAARKGLKPEDAAALEAQWRGEAAELVLNRLVSKGRYAQARGLLADPTVQQVLGDRIAKFEGELTRDERDAEGAGQARGFVAAATNREGMFRRDVAQKQLDALLESDVAPEVKKAAQQEFDAAAARAERAWNGKVSDAAERAVTKIVTAGSLSAAADEKRWLLREDVNGGKVWTAIEAHWNGVLRERAGKLETPAQQTAMVDFLVQLPQNVQRYAAQPETFKTEWVGKLSPKDLERAASMVAVQGVAARKPDETLPPTVVAAVTSLGHDAGAWGKKGPTSDEQKMRFYELHRELLEEQGRLKAAGGGKVDQDALLDYARKRLRKGRVLDTGTFRDDRTTELDATTSPGYADKIFIAAEDEKTYREKLRSRGWPENDDWIRWLHLAAQGVSDENNPMPGRPPPPTAPGMTPEATSQLPASGFRSR